jgi:hypothetical protein
MNDSIADLTLFLNGDRVNSPNDECPICLEKFEPNDNITYGCEARHFHHKECFDQMVESNNYTCSLCKNEANIKVNRVFKICGSCRSTHEIDKDRIDSMIKLPFFWILFNCCCPCAYLKLTYLACCTKTDIIVDDITEGILTESYQNPIME